MTINAMTFAARLIESRKAAGKTQQQVADACGLTGAAISKMEAGQTVQVLAPNLFAMADFLGVSARWLALGEGERVRPRTVLDDILGELPDLTLEQQEAVRSIVHSMKR